MGTDKERNGCITAWLWVGIVINLALASYCAVTMFSAYSAGLSWALGLGSVLCIVNILGAILLMRWNKTGFYILSASAVLSIAVNLIILGSDALELIGSVVAILIWWAILQAKKNGKSAWSQLESGWDIAHCRHLYQVFGGIIAVLLILTVFAAIKVSKDDSEKTDDLTVVIDDEEMDSTEVNDILVFEEQDTPPDQKDDSKKPEDNPRAAEPAKKSPAPESSRPTQPIESKDDGASTQQEADRELKAAIVEANNTFVPMSAGTGVVITRIYLSGDYVTYVAECDENMIDMNQIKTNKSNLMNELRKSKSNPEVAQFLRMCIRAGKGIAYRYVGDTSGTKVSVFFTNAELKKL